MPTSSGPNTLGESNLVFAYDTGDVSNSYRGKPGYNVLGTPYAWVGNSTATYFKTNVSTTTVNIPAIGTREVATVSILNDYPNSGNCCPSLWRYGDWGITNGVVGNTLYTYSIIYKTNSGYTHPNFMYRYEYNGGSYILETGVFDTAKRIDLGDGWYQAYNTFTTNASTNVMYLGMWYYQYGVQDTVYLYKVSLTQGTHTFPPEQIIPPSTTRSVTQGLLPVIGNSTIDLTNVSFDSNAQMVFDGTNDYIATSTAIPCNFGTGDFTVEVMIYPQSFASYTHMVALPSQSTFALKANITDGAIYYYDPAFTTYGSTSGWTLTLNQWNHVVLVRSGNTAYGYLNGVLKGSKVGFNTNFSSTQIVNIGNGGTSEYTQKEVDIIRIYNRALTAQEVTQNYQQYKTRFNLS